MKPSPRSASHTTPSLGASTPSRLADLVPPMRPLRAERPAAGPRLRFERCEVHTFEAAETVTVADGVTALVAETVETVEITEAVEVG